MAVDTQTLARSPHIMQQFKLEPVVNAHNARPPLPDGTFDYVDGMRTLDQDPNLLLMRLARYGNLDTWIRKVNGQGEEFPEAIIWRVFQCC